MKEGVSMALSISLTQLSQQSKAPKHLSINQKTLRWQAFETGVSETGLKSIEACETLLGEWVWNGPR